MSIVFIKSLFIITLNNLIHMVLTYHFLQFSTLNLGYREFHFHENDLLIAYLVLSIYFLSGFLE